MVEHRKKKEKKEIHNYVKKRSSTTRTHKSFGDIISHISLPQCSSTIGVVCTPRLAVVILSFFSLLLFFALLFVILFHLLEDRSVHIHIVRRSVGVSALFHDENSKKQQVS